jgi:hypothetical protein
MTVFRKIKINQMAVQVPLLDDKYIQRNKQQIILKKRDNDKKGP